MQANAKTTEGRQLPESKAIGGIKNLEPLKSFPVLSSAAFKRHNVQQAQDNGLTIWWAHDLDELLTWINQTRST